MTNARHIWVLSIREYGFVGPYLVPSLKYLLFRFIMETGVLYGDFHH